MVGTIGIKIISLLTLYYRPPHCLRGREVLPGQLIHASVVQHMKQNTRTCESSVIDDFQLMASSCEADPWMPGSFDLSVDRDSSRCGQLLIDPSERYVPNASLSKSGGVFWDDLISNPGDLPSSLIAQDLYSSAEDLVARLGSWAAQEKARGTLSRRDVDALTHLASTGGYTVRVCDNKLLIASTVAGRQSIIDVPGVTDTLFRALEYIDNSQTRSGIGGRITNTIVSVLLAFPSLPRGSKRHANSKIRRFLRGVSVEDCNKVINVFGNGEYPPFSLSRKY